MTKKHKSKEAAEVAADEKRNENKHYWTAETNSVPLAGLYLNHECSNRLVYWLYCLLMQLRPRPKSGGDGSSARSVLYAKLCDIGSSTPAMKNRLCMWSTMKGGSGDAVVTSVESIPNASWITSPPRSSCQVQAVLDRSRGGSVRVAVAENGYVYYLTWVMISLLLLNPCNWADGIWPRIIYDFLLHAQIHG